MLSLKQAFAEPEGGIAGQPVVGIFAEKSSKAVLRERIVSAQHISIGEIELVFGGLRGCQRRRERSTAGRRRGIERGGPLSLNLSWYTGRSVCHFAHPGLGCAGNGSERVRHAGCIGIERRVESIAPARGIRSRRNGR